MPVRSLDHQRLHFLDHHQIHKVHQAVLRVMTEVGVRVEQQEALEVYAGAGCDVDYDRSLVKVTPEALQKALDLAPHSFTLKAPNPARDIQVSLDHVYTVAGSSALFVLDLDGKRRTATLKDLADFTRLIDALEQADVMHAMVIPQDIPQVGFDRILFSTIFQNSSKHYYSQGQGGQSVRDQVEMAAVLQGDVAEVRKAPWFSFVVCFNSPLVHSAERVQEMIECARFNIPIWLEPTNMMGATAPITIAGALVEHLVNALTGLVLMQALNPGHPCILAVASGGFNMRNGTYVAASPEAVLLHCATAQMAHFYGLPMQGGSGVDSCVPDGQAGYERMLQAVPMTMAGVNFIHLAFGMMDQLLTSSYEQAVIDNEIISAAFRLAEGFEVTDETLALDQFHQVGVGGSFFNHPYTLRNFRRHQWQPTLTSRMGWEEWLRTTGGMDIRQRANQVAAKIIREHEVHIISQTQSAELTKMARAMQARAIEFDAKG